ncbi:MAG: hypothetical protein ACQEQD_06740 [Bacillota bacterium]
MNNKKLNLTFKEKIKNYIELSDALLDLSQNIIDKEKSGINYYNLKKFNDIKKSYKNNVSLLKKYYFNEDNRLKKQYKKVISLEENMNKLLDKIYIHPHLTLL